MTSSKREISSSYISLPSPWLPGLSDGACSFSWATERAPHSWSCEGLEADGAALLLCLALQQEKVVED